MSQPTVKISVPSEYKELYNPAWRNIVYYGGRYSGKSYTVAESLILRGRQSKKRILCTREFQNTIRDSVHKLLADIINKYEFSDYVITNDAIRNTITGTDFVFRGLHNNVTEIKSLEGIDIAWVEEAQSITDSSLDILTPTIRKEGSQIIYTFNRVNELDPVYVRYVLNAPANTYVKKVNYDTLEKYNLISDVIKAEIEQDKLNSPQVYSHKWLGEPLSQAEMAILSREKVLNAMQREVDDDGAVEVGVDVARMGMDRSEFYMRKGLKIIKHAEYSKLRLTVLADKLEEFVNYDKEILLKIDDTGVGGGLTDIMIERGYNIMAINFGSAAVETDKYPNWISEAWFYMDTILDQIQLPMDSDLLMELTTRQWKQDNKGKRAIESKVDYKRRGFRSPDKADGLIICYYTPVPVVVEWAGVR